MTKLRDAILANPYTSLIAAAALVALALYSKQLTASQVIHYIITVLLAGAAADGGKDSK